MPKSKESAFDIIIPIVGDEDNYHAYIEAKSLAKKAGFGDISQALIGTVVSELSTNIIRYANRGEISIKIINENGKVGIELKASDNGPGIEDVEKAMEDNYSTTKHSLGLGLSSLKRIMDEYEISSKKDEGTIIIARIWQKNNEN